MIISSRYTKQVHTLSFLKKSHNCEHVEGGRGIFFKPKASLFTGTGCMDIYPGSGMLLVHCGTTKGLENWCVEVVIGAFVLSLGFL